MKLVHYTFIALLFTALGGCRISIVVPKNGYVETASGRYHCLADEACDIDVNGYDFIERFIAVPAPGYAFRWWASGESTLCADSMAPCKLSSRPLAEVEWGQAFLDSQSTFYLKPVFTIPHGSSTLRDVSSSRCFNAAIFEEGYKAKATYIFPGSDIRGRTSYVRKTLPPAQLNGEHVSRIRTRVVDRNGVRHVSNQVSSFLVDTAVPSAVLVRSDVSGEFTDPERKTRYDFEVGEQYHWDNFKVLYEPGIESRFDLRKGDEFTQSIALRQTYGELTIEEFSALSIQIRYDGLQEITVPAGTYNACRFHSVVTDNDHVSEHIRWYAETTGVLLMETDGELTPKQMLVEVIL